jgi:hypothetical protein
MEQTLRAARSIRRRASTTPARFGMLAHCIVTIHTPLGVSPYPPPNPSHQRRSLRAPCKQLALGAGLLTSPDPAAPTRPTGHFFAQKVAHDNCTLWPSFERQSRSLIPKGPVFLSVPDTPARGLLAAIVILGVAGRVARSEHGGEGRAGQPHARAPLRSGSALGAGPRPEALHPASTTPRTHAWHRCHGLRKSRQ